MTLLTAATQIRSISFLCIQAFPAPGNWRASSLQCLSKAERMIGVDCALFLMIISTCTLRMCVNKCTWLICRHWSSLLGNVVPAANGMWSSNKSGDPTLCALSMVYLFMRLHNMVLDLSISPSRIGRNSGAHLRPCRYVTGISVCGVR